MGSKYRGLNAQEIDVLLQNGNSSSDWSKLKVIIDFNPQFVSRCHFEGEVRIGTLGRQIIIDGRKLVSGLYNSSIVDSTIANNCYISSIAGQLQGVDVEDDVIIDHCYSIENRGESTFGNGVEVSVLNEAGGRSVRIFDKLSAQLAYILTFYRYKPEYILEINRAIDNYLSSKKSVRSYIGKGAVLLNCNIIRSVNIGSGAQLTSIQLLSNGTINSTLDNKTQLGSGVIAQDFIISYGADVSEQSNIKRTFIGEGTVVSKGYTIEESIVLSNGQFYNGEACSIFAGPHAVTHHKSTLLIGGAFSFFNAGSGTNQSNHLYKIGPVHQGVTERGVKTGSDSYILWPAQIGCFTVVLGRHYNHPDISDLPFSYLIEKDGESILYPGLTLKTIGTYRDISKWSKRDKRGSKSNDVIDYDIDNWYIIGKLIRAIDLLEKIKSTKESTIYNFNGVVISSSSLAGGIKAYQQAINYYIGLKFIAFDDEFERFLLDPKVDLLKDFKIPVIVDMAGMFADKDKLFAKFENIATFRNVEILQQEIRNCRVTFTLFDEIFFIRKYIWNKYPQKVSWEERLELFLNDFVYSVKSIHSGIISDAKKEFNEASSISFGVDEVSSRKSDFINVRGSLNELSEIEILEKEETNLINKVNKYLKLLEGTKNS